MSSTPHNALRWVPMGRRVTLQTSHGHVTGFVVESTATPGRWYAYRYADTPDPCDQFAERWVRSVYPSEREARHALYTGVEIKRAFHRARNSR